MKPKQVLFGRFTFKRIMFSILEIYLLLSIAAWFVADRIIHHPPVRKYESLTGEVTLTASDGVQLSAVWIPNSKATCTILLSHGNAEDIGFDLPFLQELSQAGFNVFAYDYRGYGHSQGKPSEKGLYRDIEAAYNYLIGPLKVLPEHILVLGRSLGSGPSAYLAGIKPVGGLVLESAFTSIFRTVIPFPFFPFDQFPNLKRLSKIKCPILVIHGTKDTIVSIQHGKKLYDSYQGAKQCFWVEGADHNDLYLVADSAYLQRILAFVQEMVLSKR